MTSVLPEAQSKVTRMKQTLLSDLRAKEEARSFLGFSRENMSISQSDIEQGFNKYRMRPWRNTILSLLALSLSLVCLSVEIYRFHYTTVNVREIEDLRRTVENLKHRLLKEDLLDKLKAFEEQLDAESGDDDDPGDTDIDSVDYGSNYDEENFSSHDYTSDYQDIPKYGAKPSDFPDSSSTIVPVPTPPELSTNKALVEEMLTRMRKHESKNAHKLGDQKNNTENSAISKNKRSIEESHGAKGVANRRRTRNKMRRMRDAGSSSRETLDDNSDVRLNTSCRYPPKKYSNKRIDDSPNGEDMVAFHFHGNTDKRIEEDEYYGNGKIRHKNSVFKAWESSAWVSEFNMNRHFVLARNGTVTVKTAGLYLVYGQIHYHDNSPELGFHIKVNNEAILQCMIDNSICQRNISQTCYSAQLMPLKRNDNLVFQEVAFTRSVIFNKVNSFFGLVKLGELPKGDD